jgi:hypothetical protein
MEFLSLEECSLYNANYLGLPLFINQMKKPAFEDIKAKVLNKLIECSVGKPKQSLRLLDCCDKINFKD